MAKLIASEIIKFLEELQRKEGLHAAGYTHPYDMTADGMAKRFGVSKVAMMNKLRALESEGIVVSTKSHVQDMPTKRLVFSLKKNAIDERSGDKRNLGNLASEIGFRDIIFEVQKRTWWLNSDGSSHLDLYYRLKNISNKTISEFYTPKLKFDIFDKPGTETFLTKVMINGKNLDYESENLIYYKRLINQPVLVETNVGWETEPQNSMEVVYVFPFDKPMRPGATMEISATINIGMALKNLHIIEFVGGSIAEIILKQILEVHPPDGFKIEVLKRYGQMRYPNGCYVKDDITELRKTDIEGEIAPPVLENNVIHWEIDKPIMSHTYFVPFRIV